MRSAELVGLAQPIAYCGKVGRVGRRGAVAQRRVRPALIVVVDLVGNLCARVVEAEEQAFVEQLGLR
jgi:hypothetical protein